MGKQKEVKTNAMRILDSLKISYEHYTYECEEFIDAIQIADKLGQPYEKMYKTLVTVGHSKNYFVFVIPIAEELDMKKAAKSVGEKSVAMIPVKEINAVTGYIRGGCTAIGMKKQYVTRIDESALEQEKMIVSGGKLGSQIELTPLDFQKAAKAEFAQIIVKEA
ncbi:MAG: Cys-tRNA(Pro) deacylase [Lachnospiraceae bacterium]|nr:Cys-tRNA(Pro) deacylase [Lachnospiraceae bacterium]MBO5291762.1 Cys-tRNA(Pro) deacylase [Lachnospiraceae bacterium]